MSEQAVLKADDIKIFSYWKMARKFLMLWPCIKTWWAQKKTERRGRTAQGGPVRLN